ncbi:MAG: tyrosine-protein phosphatase [Janthinobacterium lividum]
MDQTPDAESSIRKPMLESAPNFRDMGGYPSRDGRVVRHGLLFRSGILAELSDDDLYRLKEIGVRTVCDLRSIGERTRYTTAWHEHGKPEILNFDLNVDVRGREPEILRLLRTDPTPEGAHAGMIANYREMPDAMAPHVASLFDRMLDPASVPMLVHCHAGKDRTGFVCALMLLALDVPLEAVMDDYMLTASRYDPFRQSVALTRIFAEHVPDTPLTPATMHAVASVRPAYLHAALDAIDARYGSLNRYMSETGGLDEARRARLLDLYLQPDPLACPA